MPIIELSKINFAYGEHNVLEDVSFSVEEGDVFEDVMFAVGKINF